MADDFCPFDLAKCWVAVPDREEQLGILIEADSTITPRHQMVLLESQTGASVTRVS
jgi:hypothetical protein